MSAPSPLLTDLDTQYGLRNVRDAWLRRHASFSAPSLSGALARADIQSLTRGTLPWRVCDAHNVALGVAALVQVEDVINIGTSDPRSPSAPCTLQTVLSDGAQEFVGVEWRALKGALRVATLPGTKIVLAAHARVRRGRVLLTPDCVRVVGAPPADVWAARGPNARAEGLRAAGLPVPAASTFDVLAAQGPVPPSMGIAAVALTESQPTDGVVDYNDDAFWQAAVAAADASVAQTAPTQTQPALRAVPQDVQQRGAPSAVRVELAPPQMELDPLPLAPVSRSTGSSARRDIIMDSDADSDETVEAAYTPPTTRALHHVDDRRGRSKGDTASMYRVFALRSRMSGDESKFTLRMTFDDGCGDGICDMTLNKRLTDRMTGGLTSAQIMEKSRTESEVEFKAFKNSIRAGIRVMHGFALVEHEENSDVLTDVVAQPPEGMNSFLAKYVANVEYRWKNYQEKKHRSTN